MIKMSKKWYPVIDYSECSECGGVLRNAKMVMDVVVTAEVVANE